MSGSNGGESPSGVALETPVGEVRELEGLLDGVDDSPIRVGFLADWPDTEAADPDAGGTDGAADMPSGWGDWGPGSLVPGDRSSDSRLA